MGTEGRRLGDDNAEGGGRKEKGKRGQVESVCRIGGHEVGFPSEWQLEHETIWSLEMKDTDGKTYSPEELKLRETLLALLEEWWKQVGDPKEGDGCFVYDGFYPNYLAQKPKILFLGRDAYDIWEDNYIDKFLPHYLSGQWNSQTGESINSAKFHKMLIEVAYGILHECSWNKSAEEPEKESVPYASEICESGRIFEQVSFAFMNLCKWSHWSGEGCGVYADWNAIGEFVEKSMAGGRNFIMEEIALLAPDIIITMNFQEDVIKKFTGGSAILVDATNPDCFVYRLELPHGTAMLFDSWHFASTKSEEYCIYNPLFEQIDRYWRKVR